MFDDDIRSYLTDEDRQEIYAQAKAEGKAEGLAEGEARGEVKGKTEMAKALKELGDSNEKIALVSGLSPEEIASL